MIDLYYWTTPNGHKVTIFLEEAELPYRLIPVNIGKGEQFQPEFLRHAPNNRIPAIVDNAPADGGEPVSVFESGAILQYLGEKTGRFLPADVRGRFEVMEWVFWQMAGLGPMAGQNHHFAQYAPERIPYAIDRYVKETNRLYGVLDRQLAGRRSSPASIRSPTWHPTPGSCPTSARDRTSTTSPTSRAGSSGSRREPPCSGPMLWRRRSIRSRRCRTRQRKSSSARRRPVCLRQRRKKPATPPTSHKVPGSKAARPGSPGGASRRPRSFRMASKSKGLCNTELA